MLKFKDASDFKGRNVNENLYNIRLNSDALSSSNDIILSVHFNGFNEKANGTETWSFLGDSISKPIADRLSKDIAAAQGIVNRGQKSTTDLYVVSQTKAHMILLEICFLDNYQEINNYIKNKQKVINAIIKACEAFPQYNFTATHGGHYGLGMMDPGVSRHGYKEAVLAQEINQALLKNKSTGGATTSKPRPKEGPGPWIRENKRVTVNNKDAQMYNGFNWSVRQKGADVGRRQFNVTGKYEHANGQTYYSLYNDNGEWNGYINKNYTSEVSKANFNLYTKSEGQWHRENKRVMIHAKDCNIYSDFKWKEWKKGIDTACQIFKVTGKYYHQNGFTYYSLYDDKGKWCGYINAGFTSELK